MLAIRCYARFTSPDLGLIRIFQVLGLPHTVPSRGPVPPGLKPRLKGLNAGNATAKGNAKRPERPPARKHERPHGEKPFGCAFCEKRFTRKVNAAQHERAHRS